MPPVARMRPVVGALSCRSRALGTSIKAGTWGADSTNNEHECVCSVSSCVRGGGTMGRSPRDEGFSLLEVLFAAFIAYGVSGYVVSGWMMLRERRLRAADTH